MIDVSRFKPNTVYVTYIAATPESVWQALTDPAFTRQYFGGLAIEVEPTTGGAFVLRNPDGSPHMSGEVVDWSPPVRFSCTWRIEGMPDFRSLPVCLVTYEIAQVGGAVRLTMTEAHSWDIPAAILQGGRTGWPAILSSLKSVLETGKPLDVKLAPPEGMVEAVKRAAAERPWEKR
jgi:uncharacterized protein YndB with AHSA1/START domain